MVTISKDEKWIIKVGQEPAWSIDIEPYLEKIFGKYVNDYKKGLINESQGYGIGAFAYYRRIVEVIIDELLNDILSLTP